MASTIPPLREPTVCMAWKPPPLESFSVPVLNLDSSDCRTRSTSSANPFPTLQVKRRTRGGSVEVEAHRGCNSELAMWDMLVNSGNVGSAVGSDSCASCPVGSDELLMSGSEGEWWSTDLPGEETRIDHVLDRLGKLLDAASQQGTNGNADPSCRKVPGRSFFSRGSAVSTDVGLGSYATSSNTRTSCSPGSSIVLSGSSAFGSMLGSGGVLQSVLGSGRCESVDEERCAGRQCRVDSVVVMDRMEALVERGNLDLWRFETAEASRHPSEEIVPTIPVTDEVKELRAILEAREKQLAQVNSSMNTLKEQNKLLMERVENTVRADDVAALGQTAEARLTQAVLELGTARSEVERQKKLAESSDQAFKAHLELWEQERTMLSELCEAVSHMQQRLDQQHRVPRVPLIQRRSPPTSPPLPACRTLPSSANSGERRCPPVRTEQALLRNWCSHGGSQQWDAGSQACSGQCLAVPGSPLITRRSDMSCGSAEGATSTPPSATPGWVSGASAVGGAVTPQHIAVRQPSPACVRAATPVARVSRDLLPQADGSELRAASHGRLPLSVQVSPLQCSLLAQTRSSGSPPARSPVSPVTRNPGSPITRSSGSPIPRNSGFPFPQNPCLPVAQTKSSGGFLPAWHPPVCPTDGLRSSSPARSRPVSTHPSRYPNTFTAPPLPRPHGSQVCRAAR
uniref:Uncharacterized protein n=1 Tax=Noctiluca scintillans TaxID=2966 RepID=A0A7S1A6Y5_NOCSC|mmetsp:Transcript_34344/g.91871  ORF Transcript_34344/g.91871 Transcript_34344/m.91871 type:complete len:683 (+) Transcript_34344:118-2166(+)